jgi:hypothetical protein
MTIKLIRIREKLREDHALLFYWKFSENLYKSNRSNNVSFTSG